MTDSEKGKNNYLLYLEDVSKSYGSKTVLNDIDLAVRQGEFCTVVGPSGCGKSTLLRLILGQEQPTGGQMLMQGKPIGFPGPDRGIVYQRYSLFPHLSILDNILLGKQLSRSILRSIRNRKNDREEALRYLESIQLAEHAHKYPHQLSGGMRQRVAIAQALIMKPTILMMDEPFGALDPGTREMMQILILELWEEYNMTIFFVTHDLEEAVFVGTRILVLSQFYTHEEDYVSGTGKGARIVADHPLHGEKALSTKVKTTAEFGQLIQEIRSQGFDPEYLQNAREFNLKHPDSFITFTEIP
ncbi:ABC transporter, ATP-binding protein (cluster 10, nitrate/sulfonate/bicarbonate) [Olavius algarvensis associated proteobacterium Delta 3]|nr:ABC transporter, ATP-binding protein (cluster 10, nitrate/sulfonate/bicarbonate) [Olavius algarvensis associated proteobacterium Delta 3]CAB5172476.1 ABC transporter, ATP-binding protein (cluster 10, nitrate/sulfonate/bicarbonate) [Olavius algarvensis associated proteobacterium Delta 3]